MLYISISNYTKIALENAYQRQILLHIITCRYSIAITVTGIQKIVGRKIVVGTPIELRNISFVLIKSSLYV